MLISYYLVEKMEMFSWETRAASDGWGNPVLDSPSAGGKEES